MGGVPDLVRTSVLPEAEHRDRRQYITPLAQLGRLARPPRDSDGGKYIGSRLPAHGCKRAPKPEAGQWKPEVAVPRYRLARKLLPNPQGLRVCCEHGEVGGPAAESFRG